MGGNHSRSHALALAAASGNESGVRELLDQYFKQQKVKQLHARSGGGGGGRNNSSDLPPMTDLADEIHLDYSVPEGDFVLELAVSNNHLLIAQLLLESGAPVDQQDTQGFTALMCACHELESGPAMSRMLLKHYNANPNLYDANGNTALHFAARENQREQVALLISSGASIDAVNDRGETPLLLAAVNGHTAMCLALLQAGADATIASRTGHAPIKFFDQHDDLQVAYRLVQANRRADTLIQVLYPFLLTSVLEVVVEYDAETYSSSMQNSCVALPRLMHHLRSTQTRSQEEEKERTRKKSIPIAEKNANDAHSPISSDNDSRNQHHSATSSASIAPPSKQSVAFHLSPSASDSAAGGAAAANATPSPSPLVPTVMSQGPQAPNLKSALKARNENGVRAVSGEADPDEVDVSFHLKYSDPLASSSTASSGGNNNESLLELLPLASSSSSTAGESGSSNSTKNSRGNRLPTIPMTSSGAGGVGRSSRSSAFNVAEEEEEEEEDEYAEGGVGGEQPNSDDEESRERSKKRSSVKSLSQNELKGLMRR